MQKFKNFLFVLPVMLILFLFTGVSNATLYDINVPLSGTQEVPPNASAGTGTLTGTYDDVTNTLVFSVSFSGLTGNTTASHFHGPAAVGVNAGVRIGLTGFPTGVTSGAYSNTFVLTAANELELLGDIWYLNIHSSSFGGGEIRGQVYATPNAILELTALIEGFYDSGSNLMVSDTLTVNLRQGASPYNLVESNKIYMKTNGSDTVRFLNGLNGTDYILQLKHRNSIETWSQAMDFTGYYSNYDMSSDASKAFGSNQVLKGVRYCIYSGDVNEDGIVDIADLSIIDNDAFNFISGYVQSDVNGDSITDLNDLSICDNNAFNVVTAIIP
ncbi:MAG: CHRD domain-containing protein [Ignavibacteria bacterium]|nr:CHRD domain-containing protein [Ignavibacteria bacterium]